MRGSTNNQCKQIWKLIDGIGTSKKTARKQSDIKALNLDKNISPKVHGFEYKDDVLRTIKDLGNYAKDHFNIKDMQQINHDIIMNFFNEKIENEVTFRSINTYIGHVRKALIALRKMKINTPKQHELFNEKTLINCRGLAKEFAIHTENENRAYVNPGAIIGKLTGEFYIVGYLQLYYGLRVTEASRIKLNQLNNETKEFKFIGKGGTKMSKILDENLYNIIVAKVKKCIKNGESGFKISYSSYSEELSQASKLCQERWHGTHGLRYNYAQNKYNIYIQNGYSKDEAMSKVSIDMGHVRKEIVGTYLSN